MKWPELQALCSCGPVQWHPSQIRTAACGRAPSPTRAPGRCAGKRVHMSLLANPSHLEAVDPIVLGKVPPPLRPYTSPPQPASTPPCRLRSHTGAAAQSGVACRAGKEAEVRRGARYALLPDDVLDALRCLRLCVHASRMMQSGLLSTGGVLQP